MRSSVNRLLNRCSLPPTDFLPIVFACVVPAIAPFALNAQNSPEVRAVVPRAQQPPAIDGQLSEAEYRDAFSTPVEYFHPNTANRAGQFFYLWDDHAFYVGLRTLDEKPFTPESPLWVGDAVEWYFDTRRGGDFLGRAWPTEPSPGAVHCFYTALDRDQLRPRFTLRPGYEQAIVGTGVKVAARRTGLGLEVEFQLPWSNFPQFHPAAGEVIGIDAELSYSDGVSRSDRSFVFGGPLSVQQPANLARVELVEKFEQRHWPTCGAVMMPLRIDVPWNQESQPETVAQIAGPPGRAAEIGRIVFHLTDLQGRELGQYEAVTETALDAEHHFLRREARWPTAVAVPGRYQVHAVVSDPQGNELTRIAPRMTSVNMTQGY